MDKLNFLIAIPFVWAIGIPVAWTIWGITIMFRHDVPETRSEWLSEVGWVCVWPLLVSAMMFAGMFGPLALLVDCLRHTRDLKNMKGVEPDNQFTSAHWGALDR